MKKNLLIALGVISMIACKSSNETQDPITTPIKAQAKQVASFKGQQVTGVTVSNKGTIFANFPRWREGVAASVVKVNADGTSTPYPNKQWNSWEIGQQVSNDIFVAIQSVVAFENNLYVLDTRNPVFGGVIDNPRIFVFDLTTNSLSKTYTLTDAAFNKNSYINDLRVDKKNNKIYATDSGRAGIVVIDINTGATKRFLDNHTSTLAEMNELSFNGKKWKNTVHSDGIALDTKNEMLYFHALTGYSLYAVPTSVLINGTEKDVEKRVEFITKTPAPDGMIFDANNNLYLADLENNKIVKFNIKSKTLSTLLAGDKVRWADTFSIYNNELYYTNSRIYEAPQDISDFNFTIYKVKL